METDEERKEGPEKMVATTQFRLPWRQRKKEEQKKGLIWIDIGVLKFQGMSSLAQ